MDSLLSNAQRCVRKADSLVKYGLYDEALRQLDKSIVFLNELKSVTSCYESIQMLNVQIDSIDRKMRSVAIKRSESIKKKNQIENIINKNKRESANSKQDKQQQQQCQQAQKSVLVENTNAIVSTNKTSSFRHASKLYKDEKAIIEELSTTNGEYKKVNEFLINEIEQLKRENDYLKVELLKIHMNDSLSDLSTVSNETTNSSTSNSNNTNNTSSISNSSSSIITSTSNASSSSTTSSSNANSNNSRSNSDILTNSTNLIINTNNNKKALDLDLPGLNMTSQIKQNEKSQHINANFDYDHQNNDDHDNNFFNCKNTSSNRIDLSKYINNEDSDAEAEDDIFSSNNNHNLDDSYTSTNMNLPPNEFTVD